MMTAIIIVGLIIVLLLLFYIDILKTKLNVEFTMSSYFAAFYNEAYSIYDKYTKADNQDDKTKAVTKLLELCKEQREFQAKLEEKLNINE